ncbi:YitT family protein [Brachybacterium halotolerans subsp. kimchii]|uniref:YitT family protein n=1 Tax=Brachybacterium halotolerans TaxID=2795215 RepID=UPI001E3FDF3B|nr:YitT family protein [Brachybacterium halotolerans]UEJ81858.1 YitT family protein [Brachybacterium halotolerans subsp. kimchii]
MPRTTDSSGSAANDGSSPEQAPVGPPPIDVVIPHRPTEDVLGVITGTFLASLGLYLLQCAGAVTGGTAGLALLLTHALPVPFAVLFAVVNLPFFVLALWKKGVSFTVRTIVCVALISLFSLLHPRLLALGQVPLLYAVIGGNLLVGVGLLIIFRHRASLGGFNILALILQERAGLRAGYVQMAMDVTVILLSLLVLDVPRVLLSAVGGMILNVVLALNHRPERYRA